MKKKYFSLLLLLFFFNFSKAQVQLSVYSEVSIITAGPGNELFEAFGHSAIRIKDPVLQLDLVYNYGMFDFNAPNFNLNFVKGTPLYSLGKQSFNQFVKSYHYQKRWVKGQVLNLNQQEKQNFFLYLENNAQPQNKNYLYDPYYNNCATKLRDITIDILGAKLTFNQFDAERKFTLRELMRQEVPWNTWGSFGINLALGSKLDEVVTEAQYMYLPDYVYSKFKAATISVNGKKENLIKREDVILNHKEKKSSSQFLSPFLIFTIFSLMGLFITYKDFKNNKRTISLDFIVLLITGLTGFVLLFLWCFTNHGTAPNNFNVLWAFAPNLLIAFLLLKKVQKRKWIQNYFKILILLLIVLTILWIVGIQSFPIAVIPFLIFLLVRYLFLQKRLLTSVK